MQVQTFINIHSYIRVYTISIYFTGQSIIYYLLLIVVFFLSCILDHQLQTFCASFVANQYKKDGRCRFKMSKPLSAFPGYFHWPLKKGDPNMQTFRKGYSIHFIISLDLARRITVSTLSIFFRLMDLFESGLVRFWVKEFVPIKATECFSSKQTKSAHQVPIYLKDLTSAFVILGIGVGLSTLSFTWEVAYYNFQQIKRKM